MQFLAQGFVVLVVGGVQHAQGVAVAADGEPVHTVQVDVGLAVAMHAGVVGFGDEDFDFAAVGHHDGAVGHGLRADGHECEGA